MYPSKLPKWVNQVMVTSNTSTSLASLGKKVIPKKMKNQQIPIDFVWICLDGGFSPTPLKNDGVKVSWDDYIFQTEWGKFMFQTTVPSSGDLPFSIFLGFFGAPILLFQPWSPGQTVYIVTTCIFLYIFWVSENGA